MKDTEEIKWRGHQYVASIINGILCRSWWFWCWLHPLCASARHSPSRWIPRYLHQVATKWWPTTLKTSPGFSRIRDHFVTPLQVCFIYLKNGIIHFYKIDQTIVGCGRKRNVERKRAVEALLMNYPRNADMKLWDKLFTKLQQRYRANRW